VRRIQAFLASPCASSSHGQLQHAVRSAFTGSKQTGINSFALVQEGNQEKMMGQVRVEHKVERLQQPLREEVPMQSPRDQGQR
jgi:hypothetical protein